jgi:ectoine hydroxylase-related dioxygenase (phytanoyl-CoA dioxygenase family)
MKNYLKEYNENGVVLVNNVWGKSEIDEVRKEYDVVDKNTQNREIIKDKPIIVLWKHVKGEQKRITTFDDMPILWNFINKRIIKRVREIFNDENKYLKLLETIIFNKPTETSNTLHWHQDVAYFPLKPNNQIAIWVPLEDVDKEGGALNYALGSHKEGIKGSINLHTREPFEGEDRSLIPENPEEAGYKVKCMEMKNTDMVCHDGYTWHYSGPNNKKNYTRKGLSVRFMTQESKFDPRPGQGAAFTKQVDLKPGDMFKGLPFPNL